jgi:hypothetical protein
MPDRRQWGPPDHRRFSWLMDELEANTYAMEALARQAGIYMAMNHTRMAQIIAKQQNLIVRQSVVISEGAKTREPS